MYSDFINKDYWYVVAGNIRDTSKYGYIVLKDLLSGGYRAVGVDLKYQNEHAELKVYGDLNQVTPVPDVLVLVVRPEIGLSLLKQAAQLGVKKVWCQPGAESQATKALAGELKLNIMADGSCIMVVRKYKNLD